MSVATDNAEISGPSMQWLTRLCNKHLPDTALNLESTLALQDADTCWEQAAKLLSLDTDGLSELVSKEFMLETARLPEPFNMELLKHIPRNIAERYTVFPIDVKADRIQVASCQPNDTEMAAMLGFMTRMHVDIHIASPALIKQWINHFYDQEQHLSDEAAGTAVEIKAQSKSRVKANPAQAHHSVQASDENTQKSAIVSLVSDMLLEAFTLNASDIHVEPYGEGGIVRYRIDGMLRVISELPAAVLPPVIQRIKAISGLNLAKKMIPQDGSVSLKIHSQPVDLRISTLPVKGGEKAVIRLLMQSSISPIDDIGLPAVELKRLKSILSHSSGVFVVTGPTGSGKSTTLYSALQELNQFDRCLVTVEDPVEYEIDGVAQISVNPAQDLTFSSALRSILRQDPDVILVGEVRDEETADIVFRAAMTGHFVMTTLHTNDAITTLSRLTGLGVSGMLIADSLRGVASQRLVRKLCPVCASSTPLQEDIQGKRFQALFPEAPLKFAFGCDQCDHTGYKGRLPLFEIVSIDNDIADALRSDADASQLRALSLHKGNRPISLVAEEALLQGKTTAAEIHRVLGEQFWIDIQASHQQRKG